MIETKTKTTQTKTKLVIDTAIFIAFLIAMDPRSSGVAVHEWLGVSALAAIVVHLLLSWDWIIQVTRRFTGTMTTQTRINYILNWVLFLDIAGLMISGFAISKTVMPFFGIHLPENFAWRSLHSATTNFFLVLLGIHTALHWSWILNTFKRYVFQPIGKIVASTPQKDVTA